MTAQQISRTNGATCGLFNLEGQQARRARRAVENLGKVRPAYAKPSRQVGDRCLEGVRMPCHGISVVCDTIKSRGNEIAPMSFPFDSMGMNPWPQRPVIQAAVLAYRKEHKLSPEQMAEILGVGPSYLHNVLYDKRVWPSLEVAQKLSEVLGLKLGDVVDDPGAEIPGSTTASSDLDRFMLRTMGSNLSKLTDTQKQAAFEAWNAIIRGYEKE